MSRRYDLLIFDWDGTLSDSAGLIVGSMQRAIAGLDLPPREDEQIRELIGLGLNEGLQLLYPELDQGRLRSLLDGYRSTWLRSVTVEEAPLFPGALETLTALSATGYRLAVATGKSRAGLDRALQYFPELSAMIELSRCADETRSKPDPLMLEELGWESGVAPERSLMVGDTEYDMAMARAIGMPAVGVDCGVHHEQRMLDAGAVAVLPDVAALAEWLESAA